MSTVRLVVDVNLMIRSLLSAGPARRFLKLAPLHHRVLIHGRQLREMREVAARPRLELSDRSANELEDQLLTCGEVVEAPLTLVEDCRDPKDNYVLSIALAGQADVILTEDKDLLELNPWRRIQILRLVEFEKQYALPPNA